MLLINSIKDFIQIIHEADCASNIGNVCTSTDVPNNNRRTWEVKSSLNADMYCFAGAIAGMCLKFQDIYKHTLLQGNKHHITIEH